MSVFLVLPWLRVILAGVNSSRVLGNKGSTFRLLKLAVSLLLMTRPVIAGETVADDTHGFSLRLPDGFTSYPKLLTAAPNTIHAFLLGDPNDDTLDIILLIETLRGTIGRERLKREEMPKGFQGRLFT